jgi:CheY-like chemotaxis protein
LTYAFGQVTFAISPLRRGKISLARKILLADDSVTAQNMGRKILADAGYEVVTVNNGSAALKKIAELKPDLVILDVYMPGYSGLEVCQRLKESQDSARIPVLLTVGKLEPFKPEEAQRVRAEGFIVKPFEASELLAALTKLEDKVVPRSESSKPGRFARAIAAAEEAGKISRNDSAGDDNGWKSRISFPHEKTEQEKTAEESATSNSANRDRRTAGESKNEKSPEKTSEQTAEKKEEIAAASVDVAALVPEGLPKDVTPEEVAAITAAAAQIHLVANAGKNENLETEATGQVAEAPVERVEEGSSSQPAAMDSKVEGSAEVPAAENKLMAESSSPAGVELGRDSEEKSEDVPMTMAASAPASSMAAESSGSNEGAGRWTAVSVALEAEEAGISLEQEMQRSYAAFVAEETAAAKVETSPVEVAATENLSETVAQVENQATPAIEAPRVEAVRESIAVEAGQREARPVAELKQPESSNEAEAGKQAEVEAAPTPVQENSVAAESVPVPEAVRAAEERAAVPQEMARVPEVEAAATEVAAGSHAFAPVLRDDAGEKRENEHEPEENPETVKSTAAAWASWRQIRDTGDSRAANAEAAGVDSLSAEVVEKVAESAAMAVAAGAEQPVQESGAPAPENSQDVANIVDSVLADLRPRLMAEITRKMAEKK